ncbi:alpha/beta hydrolase [Kiloniella spongiae]|uniref:Alpha/beta hydrolase n=1 Tax=Kiloniella spongiae TaxID=1489064 RepID=A0A0H2MMS2_9PROT|nr:alpha/beta family hydrolase [Kiloniella spongiae]KLN62067.1 alpha/beta hydrolase [Kiloniella spongiae]
MTSIHFLHNGPEKALNTDKATILFAHGSGAPMDTDFMNHFAEKLGNSGHHVIRFEFPFMADRRKTGKKRPPDRAPKLLESWREIIVQHPQRPLYIMGKSLGGRMASMIADETTVTGTICLGYPFHPPGKPEKTRTAHLENKKTPCLIVQGTRDPFGKPDEVEHYLLSDKIKLYWSEDGDHNLTPRKRSGRTSEQNWSEAIDAINAFIDETNP